MFVLITLIASFAISGIGIGIMLLTEKAGAILLPCLFMFALMIPSWAVMFRRLHDIGRSAWFILVNLIPVVGGILLLVVLMSKGIPDNNHYGKNPATTKHGSYYRIRSSAVALIISSFFWLLSQTILIFIWDGAVSNQMLVSLLLPVGLFLTGSALFSKRMFFSGVAWSLIIFSLLWLLLDVYAIQNSFSGLLLSFNIPLVIHLLTVIVPVALLLSGIYIAIKKTDRTVPACLLFIGSCVWIISIMLDTIQFSVSQYDLFVYLSKMMVIVVPVSLMVLARTMLSKNLSARKSKNEQEEPVKMKVEQQGVDLSSQLPVLSSQQQAIVQTTQPDAIQVIEEAEQPAVVQVNRQSEQPETVQVVEHTEQPETVQVVEPSIKPESIPVVEQTTQPTVQAVVPTEQQITKPEVGPPRKKVVFLREDRDNDNVWVVYKAPTKTTAMTFLSRQRIDRPSYYVVVETPEGNFGKDNNGIYQE